MSFKKKTDFLTSDDEDDLGAAKAANSENILANSLSGNYLYLQDHNVGRIQEDEESHYYYVEPANTSKKLTKSGFFRALLIFLSGILLTAILVGVAVLLLFWKRESLFPTTQPSNSSSFIVQKPKTQSDDDFPRFCTSFLLDNSPKTKKELNKCRREFVLNMTRESWAAYSHFAWGNPTLLPVSERGSGGGESFFPGGTIIAAMSTLWVMDLKEEWAEGLLWIEMMGEKSKKIPGTILSQLIIDVLGGLLSAYALSGRPVLLERAREVYGMIEPVAFSNQTGLMANKVNPTEGKVIEWKSVLSSIGFEQPELHYLAALTGDHQLKRWLALNRKTIIELGRKRGNGLLLPTEIDASNGQLLNSVLSPAASTNTNFLYNGVRSYAQQGGKDRDFELLRLYAAVAEAMQKLQLVKVMRDGLTYVRDYDTQTKVFGKRMSHFSVELAAALAYGSSVLQKTKALGSNNNGSQLHDLHLQMAINITETCYQAAMATTAKLIPAEWSTLNVRPTNGWLLLA